MISIHRLRFYSIFSFPSNIFFSLLAHSNNSFSSCTCLQFSFVDTSPEAWVCLKTNKRSVCSSNYATHEKCSSWENAEKKMLKKSVAERKSRYLQYTNLALVVFSSSESPFQYTWRPTWSGNDSVTISKRQVVNSRTIGVMNLLLREKTW